MYKIINKEKLTKDIFLMDVEAPKIARSAKPGQFIILMADKKGERIPLTICDFDIEKGTITIVIQVIGDSTKLICDKFNEGDYFESFVGPLGMPSDFIFENVEELKKENILFMAGGVGTAPVYPQVKYLKNLGIDVDVIIGTRSKDTLIFEDMMKKVAKNVYVTTDDGSYGFHGLITEKLKELKSQGKEYTKVVAIGPMIMMKFASLLTKELGIDTIVSLNPIMVDGTGMCGACRVSVGGEVKFACVDGPEFDGHKVDFDEALRRQSIYKETDGIRKLKIEDGDTHHRKGCTCEEVK